MDLSDALRIITPVLFGGGVVGFVTAIIKARPQARQINARAKAIGLRTGAEAESVVITTMKTALESAQSRINALQAERENDRLYYDGRVQELEGRVSQLLNELKAVQTKLERALVDAGRAAADLNNLKHKR